MEDKIKEILEKYKVYGAKQDLIIEELSSLFNNEEEFEECDATESDIY